jgi:hypothetical protein
MPVTKGTRRAVMGPSRSLPFALGVWIGRTAVGMPVLDLLLGFSLAVGAPVLDAPEIGIA